MAVDPQRPPRQEHRDDRHARRLQPLAAIARAASCIVEQQVGAVALEFGIGVFAEHDDRRIGLGRRSCRRPTARRCRRPRSDRSPHAGEDRRRAGEMFGLGPRALPRQRPAARLLRDIVGAVARDQDVRAGLERQHARVLQQHQRLRAPPRAPRRDARASRAARSARQSGARDGLARVEQPGAQLDPQDAAHRIVEPRHRQRARPRRGQRRWRTMPFQLAGAMNMSSPAAIDGRAIGRRAAGHLAVPVPVADDEPVEAPALLQHAGQQAALPCILTPFQLEKLAITVCTPASSAAT